jgi:hypothetical protein
VDALARWTSTRAACARLIEAAGFDLKYMTVGDLPEPCHVVEGDLALDTLEMTTGTLLVTGRFEVRVLDIQRDGRKLATIIVFGDCALGTAYVDGWMIIGGSMTAATLIGDSTYDSAIGIAGDLVAETVIAIDFGIEVDGARTVTHDANSEEPGHARAAVPALFVDDEPDSRAYFLSRFVGASPGFMEVALFPPMLPTRPCCFCLSLQGGSVFADFDVDADGRVFAVRISYDRYGCCNAPADIGRMKMDDSDALLAMVKHGSIDAAAADILRAYFQHNRDALWSDALAHHGLV